MASAMAAAMGMGDQGGFRVIKGLSDVIEQRSNSGKRNASSPVKKANEANGNK